MVLYKADTDNTYARKDNKRHSISNEFFHINHPHNPTRIGGLDFILPDQQDPTTNVLTSHPSANGGRAKCDRRDVY